MGKLTFSAAKIPDVLNIKEVTQMYPSLNKKYENAWAVDSYNTCIVFNEIDNVCLHYGKLNTVTPYNIYPCLFILGILGSGFHIGDTFAVKGIPFLIFSNEFAIATQPIGSFAMCDDDKYVEMSSGEFDYYRGDALDDIVEDWFNYYVKNEVVKKHNIEEIYRIVPMPEHPGRFQIVNQKGVVRHNAKGYGFTSEEKARKMLFGYAAKVPIPEEDIKAYEDYVCDKMDEAFADSIPF